MLEFILIAVFCLLMVFIFDQHERFKHADNPTQFCKFCNLLFWMIVAVMLTASVATVCTVVFHLIFLS